MRFVVWTLSSPYADARRRRPLSLYTFPRYAGFARDYHFTGFPEFDLIHAPRFRDGAQFISSLSCIPFHHPGVPFYFFLDA